MHILQQVKHCILSLASKMIWTAMMLHRHPIRRLALPAFASLAPTQSTAVSWTTAIHQTPRALLPAHFCSLEPGTNRAPAPRSLNSFSPSIPMKTENAQCGPIVRAVVQWIWFYAVTVNPLLAEQASKQTFPTFRSHLDSTPTLLYRCLFPSPPQHNTRQVFQLDSTVLDNALLSPTDKSGIPSRNSIFTQEQIDLFSPAFDFSSNNRQTRQLLLGQFTNLNYRVALAPDKIELAIYSLSLFYPPTTTPVRHSTLRQPVQSTVTQSPTSFLSVCLAPLLVSTNTTRREKKSIYNCSPNQTGFPYIEAPSTIVHSFDIVYPGPFAA